MYDPTTSDAARFNAANKSLDGEILQDRGDDTKL